MYNTSSENGEKIIIMRSFVCGHCRPRTPHVEEFARDWTFCMVIYMLKNFVLDQSVYMSIISCTPTLLTAGTVRQIIMMTIRL